MSALRQWAWPALALLGAALVLAAATMTTTTPAVGLSPVPGATVALVGGAPVEWALTTEGSGLGRLRVWVASPAPPETRLRLLLSDVALPSVVLASAAAPLSAAGPDGALDLSFAPLAAGASPHSPTTTLVARLSLEGPADARVALRAAEGAGVAFEPAYVARLIDVAWPVSAMAVGRPGLFGWPPLYALLPYAFLVALLRVVLVGARAAPLR